MKRIIYIFLLVSVCVNFIGNILAQQRIYTRPYDRTFFAKKYSESQYVIGSSSKGIGDDDLYAFAGQYYITGGDPTQVNFENPPLGKYLIGVSILLFNNENMIYIMFALLTLIGTYLLAYLLFNNHLFALTAVFILIISRLFRMQYIPTEMDQLSITLLDLPLALFLLYGVISFLLGAKYRGMYLLSSLFFGLAFVTKFFPALILFLPVFFTYLWKYRRHDIVIWLGSLVIIPLIYLLSYERYFYTHSFSDFIAFHKYLIRWRLGNPVVPGNIIRTIITGTYQSWWSNQVIAFKEWWILMPIKFIFALGGGLVALKKGKSQLGLLFALSSIFVVYLSIDTVGVARYLLPIYPFVIVLMIYFMMTIFSGWNKKNVLCSKKTTFNC